jgi:transcriptional regulator with XRE-family HTH domain
MINTKKEEGDGMSSIGERIAIERQNKKMTQEEFASRLGVTPQAVSKWERGGSLS